MWVWDIGSFWKAPLTELQGFGVLHRSWWDDFYWCQLPHLSAVMRNDTFSLNITCCLPCRAPLVHIFKSTFTSGKIPSAAFTSLTTQMNLNADTNPNCPVGCRWSLIELTELRKTGLRCYVPYMTMNCKMQNYSLWETLISGVTIQTCDFLFQIFAFNFFLFSGLFCKGALEYIWSGFNVL